MKRISIEDYLKKNGSVQRGITIKSNLIDKLEIYGFVNACHDEDMYIENYSNLIMNGVVNKESSQQIILSRHIYQITTHFSGKNVIQGGMTVPIFDTIKTSEEEREYYVEDLYIPSLVGKDLYRRIKKRFGQGEIVNERMLQNNRFPDNIKAVEGKAVYIASAGHVQLLDRDGKTKSIGENILAVCRYLHPVSGAMCYTQYNLNEVFVDDIH